MLWLALGDKLDGRCNWILEKQAPFHCNSSLNWTRKTWILAKYACAEEISHTAMSIECWFFITDGNESYLFHFFDNELEILLNKKEWVTPTSLLVAKNLLKNLSKETKSTRSTSSSLSTMVVKIIGQECRFH